MKFNSTKIFLAALTGMVVLLYSSCTKDILDDTEVIQATQLKATTSKTVTLSPIQDAYLQDGNRYNSSVMRLDGNRRQSYMMFDLSAVDGKITAANLQFTIGSDSGNGTIKAYLGNGTNWTETNLSTQNKPSTGAMLGSINKSYYPGVTQKINLNTSSLAKGKTSLVLVHSNGNDLNFSSAETSKPPKLTITYSSSGSGSSSSTTESKSSAIAPIQDAYLQNGTRYNSSLIRLDGNRRQGYLIFDLSKISGQITSASLQFTISTDPGNGTIKAYLGNGTSWTETNLSTQNKPSTGTLLGSINKTYSIGATEKIKLNSSSINKGRISLVLMHSDGNDLAFASGETSQAPKLLVTYSGSGSSDSDTSSDSGSETSSDSGSDNTVSEPSIGGKGFYVTVNGKSSNSGLGESSAWSLKHAFNAAKAGDVIYIKAGNYGNVSLTTTNSGSSGKPIKFIGYTNTPGDLVSNGGPTFKYGENLSASKMPLLQGSGNGTAISLDKQYIELENFQITKYKKGVNSIGKYCVLKNIIATQIGSFSSKSYSGIGIYLRGDYSTIKNCIVVNAGAEGFTISGDNVTHDSNKVYCDTGKNETDYYYLLHNANNNKLNNIYVERVGNLYHKGHGITFKVSAKNNVIRNSSSINTSFELSFSGVENNRIENCFAGNYDSNVGRGKIGSFLIANGAHHNTFKNCTVDKSSESGVKFMDWREGSHPNDAANAGNNNVFENCTFSNVKYAIDYNSDWNYASSPAENNTFKNSTFKNSQYLFRTERTSRNNKLIGSRIQNIANYKTSRYGSKYNLGTTITSTTLFTGNGFSKP